MRLLPIVFLSLVFSPGFPCFGDNKSIILGVEKYLNAINTFEASLIQISSAGEVETGQILIKKPGQMRFEYDPPSNHLVMASGILLVIIDKKSNAEPQRYLTSQTPIGYLLTNRIELTNNSTLKTVFVESDRIHIILADNEKPQSGQLELVFSQQPINLKEWTITNYSGEKTRVLLEKVFINNALNDNLFDIGHAISSARKELMAQ